MSVQAVSEQIRIAKLDHVITEAEAKAIVKAAKHNVQKSERKEIDALLATAKKGDVKLESHGAEVLRIKLDEPKPKVAETLKNVVTTPAAPAFAVALIFAIGASHVATTFAGKAWRWAAAAIFAVIAAACAIIALPITLPYGAGRGIYLANRD